MTIPAVTDDEFVPEAAVDYDEVFRRGGDNLAGGNENFALFKCPLCGQVYLMEYEIDTVYLDGKDLSKRVPVSGRQSFTCVRCNDTVPQGGWVGPKVNSRFRVSWRELEASDWAWAARRESG